MPQPWFEILRLPGHVYALAENGHAQGVCSFLIPGSRRALLFDTGMGIGDIAAVARQLTGLEIVAVNSHTHFDHTGDDWRFAAVHVYAHDDALRVLTAGLSHWELRFDAQPARFTRPLPAGFDLNAYAIRPVPPERIIPLHDGHIFDLGDRCLEVIHTPGHSQDSIMLLDRRHRALFTGDTYCSELYAFFGPQMPNFGVSDLVEYQRSLQKVARLAPGLDYLHPSHGRPLADPAMLARAARALEQVVAGEAPFSFEEIYGEPRRTYAFDGFSIVL
jgi:glyoxylase-like metal-dependent hydrolase (beta-lactamase superfamily II)